MSDNPADREIATTRVFPVSVSRLYEAWTDPKQIQEWWGPKDFRNTFQTFDLKPGGLWKFVMHGPDGTDYANESEFIEIVKDQKIVFRHKSQPEFLVTVKFEELGDHCKLTWRMLFESVSIYNKIKRYAVLGNEQNVDRLAAFLSRSTPPTVLIDTFVVPADSVASFLENSQRMQSFLCKLPGFIEGFLYEKKAGEGRYNFITSAVWVNAEAIENAKQAMAGEFQRLQFNPQEFRKKLGIESTRAVYSRKPY